MVKFEIYRRIYLVSPRLENPGKPLTLSAVLFISEDLHHGERID